MPTLSAAPDVAGSRVQLTLNGWAAEETTVYRRDGATRVPVRSANPVQLSGGVALVNDWEMPLNTPVAYEALDGADLIGSSQVTVNDANTWLKIPAYPDLNRIVHLAEVPALERPRRQSIFQALGARLPTIISDARSASSGTLSIVTLSAEEALWLEQMLTDTQVFLLQARGSWGSRYVAIGDVTASHVVPKFGIEAMRWDCAFTEVAAPTGGVIGNPFSTYQMVKDTYATYGALKEGEADYLDLVAGVDPPLTTPTPTPDPDPDPDPDPTPTPTPEVLEDEIMSLGVVYAADYPGPKRAESAYTAYCTGTNDETVIQSVIDAVAAYGGGSVMLKGRLFNVGGPTKLKTGIKLFGESLGTVLKATSSFTAGIIELADNTVHATTLSDFTLDGNGRDVHGVKYVANGGQVFTSTPNTNPDPSHVIERLNIMQCGSSTFAGHGMWMQGGNLRAGKYSDIRILACRGNGVWVDGAVDSHYTNIEIGSSGGNGPAYSTSSTAPVGHGFYVSAGDNNMFTACKAWYSRGAGFYNRGTRNGYNNCQAQDNYSNGFHFAWGKSSASNCHADSNGQAQGADGRGSAGFYIATDLVTITGCEAYDKGESGTPWQQQAGFQFNSGCQNSRIVGCVTYGNVASTSGTPGAGVTIDIVSPDGT